MKHLIIATSASTTINSFHARQIELLSEEKWKIEVICGDEFIAPELKKFVHSTHYIKMKRYFSIGTDLVSLYKSYFLIKSIKPTHIISSTPKASLLTLIVAAILGVKVRIYLIRGARWETLIGLKKVIVKISEMISIRLATHCLSVSPSLKDLYNKEFNIDKKIMVLGNGASRGVNLSIFKPTILRQSFNFKIGYLGRIANDKGVHDLLDLFNSLLVVFPSLKLEIIAPTDELDGQNMDIIERVKSNKNTVILRDLAPTETAKKVCDWDMMVFLSKREGLPNAILEASACGTPTFSWNVTGVKDCIENGINGMMFEYKDMLSLKNYIVNFFSSAFQISFRITSRNYVAQKFDEVKVNRNFLDFMRHV
jgi:glycosyltransferase involved in cell wall biosynthesis